MADALRPPMHGLSRFIHLTLASQGFIALCAVALTHQSTQVARAHESSPAFYLFVLLATFSAYRFHAHVRGGGLSPWITAAAVAVACVLLPELGQSRAGWLALAACLTWGYSMPFWPGTRRIREFGLAKPLVLAGVWTLVTAVLPLLGSDDAWILLLVATRRFLFIFVLAIAFDIRDTTADAQSGIATVPVRLGIRRSIGLMRGLLGLFAALCVLNLILSPVPTSPWLTIALLGSAVVTWVAIERTQQPRRPAYYLGCIDGMMLLQCILVWSVGALASG